MEWQSVAVPVLPVEDLNDLDFALLEERCEPKIYRGLCSDWRAAQKWTGSSGIKYLTRHCGSVEVQVMSSEDGNFHGDLNNRKTQQRTFGDFLESTTAGSRGHAEQLYLAQAPIFSANSDHEPLGKLMRDIQVPTDLRASGRLRSVNLWMASSHGSKSSLHYDQHHNLLCVVAGSKVVNLFSPLATCLLAPKPIWSESANHSQIDFANPDLRQFPGYQTAQKYRRRAELQAGDALFIPEGFWHQIDSQPGTSAVNIWWESAVQLMLLGTDSEQFYLRRLLQAAVVEKQEQQLDADVAGHPELLAVQRSSHAGAQQVSRDCLERIQLSHRLHGSRPDEGWAMGMRTLSAVEFAAATLLAADLYQHPASEPGYAEVFGALTAASLRRVLSFVAQLHPQVVVRMLRCMSPRAGALIIRRFEEADLDPELGGVEEQQAFYKLLYSGVEDIDDLQRRMVQKQEEFAKQAALATLQEKLSL